MTFFNNSNPTHRRFAEAYNNNCCDQLPEQEVTAEYQSFLQSTPQNQVEKLHQEYFDQMPQAQRMGLFDGLKNLFQQHGVDPRQAGVRTTNPQQASPNDLSNLFNYALNSGLLGGLLGGNNQQQQQNRGGGLGDIVGGLFGGNQRQQPTQNDYDNQPQYGNNTGQQGKPNLDTGLQDLLRNPLAQAAISGLVGYAANRFLNGAMGGNNQPQNPRATGRANQNYGQNQAQDYQGGGSALPGFEDDRPQM